MVNGDRTQNRGRFSALSDATHPPANTQSNHAADNERQQERNTKRRKALRIAGLAVVVALVACLAVPAWFLGRTLIVETIQAGKGADCPMCAVDGYLREGPFGFGGDDIAVRHLLCDDRRDELAGQLRDFAIVYKVALQKWKLSPRVEAASAKPQVDGDKAAVTVPVVHTHEQLGGRVDIRSTHDWRFELVNEDGWRICKVEHPDVCRDLVKCEGPSTPAPSAGPSKVWDTRVPYKCLPDKPYRDLEKGCATPPADWVQPGPYYCAPDQPFGIPAIRKQECAALGWT